MQIRSLRAAALALAGSMPIGPPLAAQGGVADLLIEHPQPAAQARFGDGAVWLDWDGDGDLDLAVSATGQSRVHLFLSDGHPTQPSLTHAPPPLAPPPGQDGLDRFGRDLAAGDLDGDPASELVVGAPHRTRAGAPQAGAVYVFGLDDDPSVALELGPMHPQAESLGESVVVADLDSDGWLDVAAGAPDAPVDGVPSGAVRIFFGPLGPSAPTRRIGNPSGPQLHGNYGHELAASDLNADGHNDLVVSAIGNPSAGIAVAGEVLVHIGPLAPSLHPSGLTGLALARASLPPIALVDPWPDPLDLPGPRYGMSVAARGSVVLVGANRKDWPNANGVMDAGVGFRFEGPPFAPPARLLHPTPMPSDLFGIDCTLADLTGDATPDLVFSALPASQPLALFVWDGAQLGPPLELIAPAGAGDHFANCLVAGQFVPGGHEELLVGDPTYDPPGGPPNSGRVAILLAAP